LKHNFPVQQSVTTLDSHSWQTHEQNDLERTRALCILGATDRLEGTINTIHRTMQHVILLILLHYNWAVTTYM